MPRFQLVLFGFTLLAACGGASGSDRTATPLPASAAGDPSCPVAVPGTSVTVEDAGKGVALAFVTTGDAAELRRRAASMAQMHNDHHGKMGALPTGDEPEAAAGGHAGHDMSKMDMGDKGMAGHDMGDKNMGGHAGHAGGMISVHSRATVEETPGGARLVFIAVPADLVKLREELDMHAKHMATGTCEMGGG